MKFEIEPMARRDEAAVLEMMRVFYASDAVLTNGSEEIFRRDVEACVSGAPYARGYVFREGEDCLGYAMLALGWSTEFGKVCVWIEDLYLKPRCRGLGIGSAFFERLFQEYPEAVFRLEAERENTRAIALYRKRGFSVLPYLELVRDGGLPAPEGRPGKP